MSIERFRGYVWMWFWCLASAIFAYLVLDVPLVPAMMLYWQGSVTRWPSSGNQAPPLRSVATRRSAAQK